MSNRPKALMAWSTGKDSAFALDAARRGNEVEVVGLLSTVTKQYGRVSMHSTREALLGEQSRAVGLPLRTVEIPAPCPDGVYAELMSEAMMCALNEGITHIVFGDLYLEDIRAYREQQLASVGMTAVFPLWGRDTSALGREMIASGLRAILTCVDPRRVDPEFVGRWYDEALLRDLPDSVDPCGENGEFHTFVSDGPGFNAPIRVSVGERVERDGFFFADVVPGG